MDNQYNYNTPNDQFQNQATGNGGPDFHFGQTDPDVYKRQEVVHMNNYCVETSEVTGKSYTCLLYTSRCV